ncbi:uncharacterized protein LOC113279278 [Papaver somniferum]|uniref:uncharacterized protein LOC113279278 n=1 Tax=Papaver somniferum TaxID=3469 RepID=UPI000E6FE417|nr:uncharacterized protein LOC113279278 [Papaver somniferum]
MSLSAPEYGFMLFCYDGSSIGNPGTAGFGIIIKDHICQVIGTMSCGRSVNTNFVAEVFAVIFAMEWAVIFGAKKIIIGSYSKSLISDFCRGTIPWFIILRWLNARQKLECVRFEHCFREINFSTDSLAKKSAKLEARERVMHNGRPGFLISIEMPEVACFRFCS